MRYGKESRPISERRAEQSLWSGSDRQGEKVAIQGDAGKDNPAIVAYFSACWFIPRGLDPKLCRVQLLQEAEEWLETQQFPLHGGLTTVQRFQGVDEGIAVNWDGRQASVGKGTMSGTKSIDQTLAVHPILKDVRFNQSFPLADDMKRIFLEFEECSITRYVKVL
jgi:hypothetical protein